MFIMGVCIQWLCDGIKLIDFVVEIENLVL